MYNLSKTEILAVSAGLGATSHSVMASLDLCSGVVLGALAYFMVLARKKPRPGMAIIFASLSVTAFVDAGIHIANAVDAA